MRGEEGGGREGGTKEGEGSEDDGKWRRGERDELTSRVSLHHKFMCTTAVNLLPLLPVPPVPPPPSPLPPEPFSTKTQLCC